MCDCPAHDELVACRCSCDHTNDRIDQWRARAERAERERDEVFDGAEQADRDAEMYRQRWHDEWARAWRAERRSEEDRIARDKAVARAEQAERKVMQLQQISAIAQELRHPMTIEQERDALTRLRLARAALEREDTDD